MMIGNICFIGMLRGVRRLSQKNSWKEEKGVLFFTIFFFLFFLAFNPMGKEIWLLDQLIQQLDSLKIGVLLGFYDMVFFPSFMPLCQFFLFRKRLHTKGEKPYRVYVYYDRLFIFTVGLWCINFDGAFLIWVTEIGILFLNRKLLLGILVAMNYIWAVIASFLQGKELVMTKEKYYYNSMKGNIEGSLEDIEEVERREEEALVFRVKGEEMPVWCGLKTYGDLIYEQCKKRIKEKG